MAVHVEDHPLDYFDFEGVIPEGEYGGGDVIVWDWGTWAAGRRREDPRAAIADGELHFDLHGEKLRGRFVLVRTKTDAAAARSSGCCCTSTTRRAEPGWDPEEHPASVKTGPDQRRGAAAPAATWSSPASGPRRPPRSWTRSMPWQAGQWGSAAASCADQPRQGAVPRQARARRPVTKRDLVRYYADDRPGDAALPRRPAGEPAPLPRRHRQAGFWHKAVPDHAPELDHAGGTTTTPTRARPSSTSCSTRPPRWPGWPTTAPSSCTPGRRRSRAPARPDLGADRHRPGHEDAPSTTCSSSPGSTAPRSTTSASQAARRSPASAASRSGSRWPTGATLRRHPGLGREAVPRRRRASVPELVSWEWEKRQPQGPGPPRLHPERHQQDARGAVQRPARRRARRCRCRSRGTSSTTPTSAPTAGRSGRCSTAWPTPAIRSPRWSGWPRNCPSCNRQRRSGAGERRSGALRVGAGAVGPQAVEPVGVADDRLGHVADVVAAGGQPPLGAPVGVAVDGQRRRRPGRPPRRAGSSRGTGRSPAVRRAACRGRGRSAAAPPSRRCRGPSAPAPAARPGTGSGP